MARGQRLYEPISPSAHKPISPCAHGPQTTTRVRNSGARTRSQSRGQDASSLPRISHSGVYYKVGQMLARGWADTAQRRTRLFIKGPRANGETATAGCPQVAPRLPAGCPQVARGQPTGSHVQATRVFINDPKGNGNAATSTAAISNSGGYYTTKENDEMENKSEKLRLNLNGS